MIVDGLKSLAVDIDTLKLMEDNPRRGDVAAVKRSYARFGQVKPIVATPDLTVIAGNHSLIAARELGWTEIAVNVVPFDSEEAKAYALADNRTADLGTYDNETLAELLADVATDPELLLATGYTEADLDALIGESEGGVVADSEFADLYSDVVNAPTYEIVGLEPPITQLCDSSKTEQLQADIANSDLPDELKTFLSLAAYRHVVFDYGKIAEFYPHQDAAVQQLMEDSALVIIDYEDAIKGGYVVLSEALAKLREKDRDDKV